ncbi:hypothetical protein EON62_05655 [archaeon]|nr:MAG: hypothetical protein EON62_05655 [archaeon]
MDGCAHVPRAPRAHLPQQHAHATRSRHALTPHAHATRSRRAPALQIIKNAGAVITHPFGGIMRSIIVALYELNANEVFVIGHHDCGMGKIDPGKTVEKMMAAGISTESMCC